MGERHERDGGFAWRVTLRTSWSEFQQFPWPALPPEGVRRPLGLRGLPIWLAPAGEGSIRCLDETYVEKPVVDCAPARAGQAADRARSGCERDLRHPAPGSPRPITPRPVRARA